MEIQMATGTALKPSVPKQLPPPNSDFYDLYETLNAEELATVKRVLAFMESKVAPVITKYWVEDAFPFELLPAVKGLGIGGLGMHGYGCAGGWSTGVFGGVVAVLVMLLVLHGPIATNILNVYSSALAGRSGGIKLPRRVLGLVGWSLDELFSCLGPLGLAVG